MLEVADRLIASIGQDTMDTFFWSLTHPSAFRLFFHFSFAVLYMFAHSFIMLLQGNPSFRGPSATVLSRGNKMKRLATTLNVAFNNHNKVLLLIMMSNNFIEIKGSVFKKFEKNNLFQVKHIFIKWSAPSKWSFRPNSARDSIDTTTNWKTRPTLWVMIIKL